MTFEQGAIHSQFAPGTADYVVCDATCPWPSEVRVANTCRDMTWQPVGEGGQEAPQVAVCQDREPLLDPSVHPGPRCQYDHPPTTPPDSDIQPVPTDVPVSGVEYFSRCG